MRGYAVADGEAWHKERVNFLFFEEHKSLKIHEAFKIGWFSPVSIVIQN